ncbi:MAG: hypothetical protein HGA62_01765 [Chlorobiaceae bacterium]|nr:hypothetical protein [Chlorobiaceae bacterium]NTV60847.1 hypothetical protein [Chlorobiaceae bacterium]
MLLASEWMNTRTLLSYWLICLGLLTVGSFVPFSGIIHNFFMIDTIMHFFLSGSVSLISMILFKSRKTSFLISFAITPFGYLLEIVHSSLSGEGFSALNAMANNAGVLAGIASGFVLRLKNHYIRSQNTQQE